MMNILCLTTVSLLITGTVCQNNYTHLEADLISALRKNYQKDARPNATTTITTQFVLFAIKTLNIGDEILSLHGILSSKWIDERLKWDPVTTGLSTVVMKTGYIWAPPMIIENEVENVGLIQKEDIPTRIFPTGHVAWHPPVLTTTSCSADITYYPYDKQKCSVAVTGWGYTIDEVDIVTIPSSPIDLSFYSQNGEWDLIGYDSELINLTDAVSQMTFRRLKFRLVLRRRWPFYGQNIMLPVVLNAILMATVFRLPLESGEKISFSLTVLLSYILLLTMVSNNLPSISSQTSVLQVYLSVVLCLGTASTLCTIAVLTLYHQDPTESVPGWLKVLQRFCLASTSCNSCTSTQVSSENNTTKSGRCQDSQSIYFKQAAKKLDQLFFYVFTALIIIITVGVLLLLMVQYETPS